MRYSSPNTRSCWRKGRRSRNSRWSPHNTYRHLFRFVCKFRLSTERRHWEGWWNQDNISLHIIQRIFRFSIGRTLECISIAGTLSFLRSIGYPHKCNSHQSGISTEHQRRHDSYHLFLDRLSMFMHCKSGLDIRCYKNSGCSYISHVCIEYFALRQDCHHCPASSIYFDWIVGSS